MQPKYDAYVAAKAPMLDSIPNYYMSEFVPQSAYTRAIAQELLITLADHGYAEGEIDRYLRR